MRALPLLLLSVVAAAPDDARDLAEQQQIITGAEDYDSCLEFATCRTEGFHCFKRAGQEYAQCRPLPRDENKVLTECYDTDRWRCPGWQQCSAHGAECTTSRCCENPDDGCYKRPYAHYAECRPKVAKCVDTREWLCPGSEGRSKGMGSWENCAQPWQKCLESGTRSLTRWASRCVQVPLFSSCVCIPASLSLSLSLSLSV